MPTRRPYGKGKEHKRPYMGLFVSLEEYPRGVVLFFTNRCRNTAEAGIEVVITSYRTTMTTLAPLTDCWPHPHKSGFGIVTPAF